VWKTQRFSWWLTSLMHRFPEMSEFDGGCRWPRLAFLRSNEAAQTAMAQNYVGLPY
jgi:p-hydroxybenzoate 3-monooxygenase